jgi:membrane protease YdiL (CAAX protease family)
MLGLSAFSAPLLAQSATPTPAPTPTTIPVEPATGLLIWGGALLLAALIFWRTRAYRASTILGPLRLDPREPLSPYILATGIALLAWVMVPAMYVAITRAADASRAGPASAAATHPSNPMNLTAREMVSLSAAAGIIPVALLLLSYRMLHHAGLARLGLTRDNLARAFLPALVGSLLVIPVIYWFGFLLVWLFQLLHIEHPEKHQLLLLLDQTRDSTTQLLMVFAAVVVAPVFEELLFRAHIQTILSHLISRRRVTYGPTAPSPLDLPYPDPGTPHPLSYENHLPPRWESIPRPAARWASVIGTSLLFAAVHEWWTAPAIFLLSLCFGYVYERTGNLFVPIFMHVAFNGVSIILSRLS